MKTLARRAVIATVASGRCDPRWVTLAESDLALKTARKDYFTFRIFLMSTIDRSVPPYVSRWKVGSVRAK